MSLAHVTCDCCPAAAVETAVVRRTLVRFRPKRQSAFEAACFLKAASLLFEYLWLGNAPLGPCQQPVHEYVKLNKGLKVTRKALIKSIYLLFTYSVVDKWRYFSSTWTDQRPMKPELNTFAQYMMTICQCLRLVQPLRQMLVWQSRQQADRQPRPKDRV